MAAAQGAAHRLVTSDELGLLKVVDVPAGPLWDAPVVQRWGEPDRARGITALACSSTSSSSLEPGGDALLAAALQGNRVNILRSSDGQLIGSCSAASPSRAPPAVRALRFIAAAGAASGAADAAAQAAPAAAAVRLVACTADGAVSVHAAPAQPADCSNASADAPPLWACTSRFTAAPSALCMDLDAEQRQVAVGGEGCNLVVWDLTSSSQAWAAKGTKPNRIGLVDKPRTSALSALPSGCWLAGTGAPKLLLYDPRAGRRPQMALAWGASPVTALAAEAGGARVWAANASGQVEVLDLAAARMQGAMKGAAGSVRCLALHPSQPLVASVGLDRFLRVHSTQTRACVGRAYLTQQLRGVVWAPPAPAPASAAAGDGGEGEEADAAQGDAEETGAAAGRALKASKRQAGDKRHSGKAEPKAEGKRRKADR